jgi:two-component system phosphate regulon response regulator PhoB
LSLSGASRILVIDDDAKLQQRIGKLLAVAGFAVESALTASAGLLSAHADVPALIVLAIMLPDRNGNDVCRSLRADEITRAIPVLMLSVHGAAADRVRGFEAGADDYVSKPYDGRELVLRIRALLRRAAFALVPVRMIHCGRLRIDRESFRAWVDEVAVALTALEFGLLLVLYDRRDRVQSRTRLLEDVWQASGSMLTSTVDTRIKLLRRKLKSAGPYIETVRGIGYRFAPPLA